ncbi:hypothetical protein [Desulfuromonas sp.]|nr:hypothetical protein [Desulfuromonas sp.]
MKKLLVFSLALLALSAGPWVLDAGAKNSFSSSSAGATPHCIQLQAAPSSGVPYDITSTPITVPSGYRFIIQSVSGLLMKHANSLSPSPPASIFIAKRDSQGRSRMTLVFPPFVNQWCAADDGTVSQQSFHFRTACAIDDILDTNGDAYLTVEWPADATSLSDEVRVVLNGYLEKLPAP